MQRNSTIVFILVAAIAALLFFLPLRLAIGMAGFEAARFSARAVSGPVWHGRIYDAQLGSLPLGDLDAGVRPMPLLLGRFLIDLERPPATGDGGLSATVGRAGSRVWMQDVSTELAVGSELAPLPVSAIDLRAVSVMFVDGRCQSASGQVRVSLDSIIPGLDLRQGLLGNAQCQDGTLVLPLQSGSGMEQLTLKLQGNGSYSARLFLSGGDRAWTVLLPPLGFRNVGDGYAIKVAGQLAQRYD